MIIIPMVGKSSRFYNAGYKIPKFKLPIGNQTNVFREVLNGFRRYFKSEKFVFINRGDDDSYEFIKRECEILDIFDIDIITLDRDTLGQAETVFLGLNKFSEKQKNQHIYIFNIDSIRVNFQMPDSDFLEDTDGFLEVFKGEGEHWSFIEPGEELSVKKTTEKIKISNLCSNGLYYFSSIELFIQTFLELKEINDYQELFIAPMYNIIIKKGKKVKYKLLEMEQTIFSGTPKEYMALLSSNYLKAKND